MAPSPGIFALNGPAPGKLCSEGNGEAGPCGPLGGFTPEAGALVLTWDTAKAAKPGKESSKN